MARAAPPNLWILRHGQTAWSLRGCHTGLTDVPLTEQGERQAASAGDVLATVAFDLALTSPLQRARRTAALAGFPDAVVEPDAVEWDYGDYEGRTSAEIREVVPDFRIWTHGARNGETIDQVAARAARVVARVLASGAAEVLLVTHGHFARLVAATWLRMAPVAGQHFVLETGKVCTLGWEREVPAIVHWGL